MSATGGGDADECYELVLRQVLYCTVLYCTLLILYCTVLYCTVLLHQARTQLSWTPGSVRSLVMIGDCNPHGPGYPLNRYYTVLYFTVLY